MGDENPIRTLGDYFGPSHEGYRNTIELPKWNNVCEIDRAASGKLCEKNADESWEIIENLSLYDHDGWNDSSDSVKLVKAISTPQSTPKTPYRRLLELEDQINFLLKGSLPTPRPRSTHIPQAYAKAFYSDPYPRNLNEPPKQNPFTFPHIERMERFENAIFKQREEINNRMTEMFELLKELTTSRAPEKRRGRKEPIAPTMTVNRLVLEWEERIKLHLEREMEFNRWKSKNFKGKHPTLVIIKGRMDDEGEVT
ncbi:hypothetical protein Tco_1029093 [Tanacetum coccineum]|uniref:MAK10-like protein n=1 Tax=Tanacetum coccineum TaxID=301880 RepID=A0ABQ5G481_9ASTR